jgi:hypothetical protein
MRKILAIMPALVLGLCVVAAYAVKPQDPHPSPADPIGTETLCMYNHFDGEVHDCYGNPVPGVTVKITCPDGSVETCVTNSEGKYCFARPISFSGEPSWEPGYYGLTAGCLGEIVYRAGDGDIEVNLSTCCPK